MITRPTINAVFRRANATPSSLFSHPSITSFMVASITFPNAPNTRNTRIIINANATSSRTCVDAVIHCPIHPLAIEAKRADIHTPRISDTIEITCEMKPFLIPCTTAGMKHIKRMMSIIFINHLKVVSLRFEKIGWFQTVCKNR